MSYDDFRPVSARNMNAASQIFFKDSGESRETSQPKPATAPAPP